MTNVADEILPGTAVDAPPGFLAWVGQLVHAHRGRLLSYARRRGLSAEDALDAVQDGFVTFLAMPQARAIATTPGDAIKMLTVLVRHDVMNRRRKSFRRMRADALLESCDVDTAESSEALVARAEELSRANGCILRMARLQRQVVMLSLVDEHPQQKVATILGISEAYVRVLLHRAREQIKRCAFADPDDRGH